MLKSDDQTVARGYQTLQVSAKHKGWIVMYGKSYSVECHF